MGFRFHLVGIRNWHDNVVVSGNQMGFRFHLVGIRIDMMMELCQSTGWASDFILLELGLT